MANTTKNEEKSLQSNDPEFSDEQIIQDQIDAAAVQGPNDADEAKLVAAEDDELNELSDDDEQDDDNQARGRRSHGTDEARV